MVALGRVNTRMKDFYDIWILSRTFAFDDNRLARAIFATFERRQTAFPEDPPDAVTRAFAADEQKQHQWRAFIEDVAHDPGDLAKVVADIAEFLMPHAIRARSMGR